MRLVNRQDECIIKLEDKVTGELFAKCPIDKYPGVAIEAVTDSSRYFVLRIQDEGGEQNYFQLSTATSVGIIIKIKQIYVNTLVSLVLLRNFKWVNCREALGWVGVGGHFRTVPPSLSPISAQCLPLNHQLNW